MTVKPWGGDGGQRPEAANPILPVAKPWGGGPLAKRLVEGPRRRAIAPPSALRAATSPWLRHREDYLCPLPTPFRPFGTDPDAMTTFDQKRHSASHNIVIPAKAGTQCGVNRRKHWVPAFAGMTKMGESAFHPKAAVPRNQRDIKAALGESDSARPPWRGKARCRTRQSGREDQDRQVRALSRSHS